MRYARGMSICHTQNHTTGIHHHLLFPGVIIERAIAGGHAIRRGKWHAISFQSKTVDTNSTLHSESRTNMTNPGGGIPHPPVRLFIIELYRCTVSLYTETETPETFRNHGVLSDRVPTPPCEPPPTPPPSPPPPMVHWRRWCGPGHGKWGANRPISFFPSGKTHPDSNPRGVRDRPPHAPPPNAPCPGPRACGGCSR